MKAAILTLLSLVVAAQIPKEPAKDLSAHSETVPGVEVRYVDYHWQPALFDAFEQGQDIPEAKRNWVLARMILDQRPLTIGEAKLGVGNYAIVLWPNIGGKGMAVEIRQVDMRIVYPSLNALAPAPRGETMYKGPVAFETVDETAPRLDLKLADAEGRVTLTTRWGNRRLVLTLAR
jgi:hypothetical protein